MKPTLRIYVIAVLAQLLAVFALHMISDETPASDPWYLWQAESLLERGEWRTEWQMAPFAIQEGRYENWRPPLYSLLVTAVHAISERREVLTAVQIALYALLPVLLFGAGRRLFAGREDGEALAFLAALLWICNPQFLLGSVQVLDTMLITLLSLAALRAVLEFRERETDAAFAVAAGLIGVFYLLRPLGMLAFTLILLWMVLRPGSTRSLRRVGLLIAGISVPILLWGSLHVIWGGGFHIGYSSAGYNLWLGNNSATLSFLRTTRGDAATIEDAVLRDAGEQLTDLEGSEEFRRSAELSSRAIAYAAGHPGETLEGYAWKVLGFWSPFRQRDGHYSSSRMKEAIVLAYQLPLLLLCFFTLVSVLRKRVKSAKTPPLGMLCITVLLWMLPLLLFFTTPRFRTPMDPLLLCLAVLSLPAIFSKTAGKLMGRN